MVSPITVPSWSFLPPRLFLDLNFPAISLPVIVVVRPKSRRRQQSSVCVNLESCSVRFGDLNLKRRHIKGSWCCWCKNWESEGDSVLEAEILAFMNQSEKPEMFPTRQELVDGGRRDLAEAIVKRGGWLSMGWDLDEDNEEEAVQEIDLSTGAFGAGEIEVQENGIAGEDCDSGVLMCVDEDDSQREIESGRESKDINISSEVGRQRVSGSASQSPSSSGRSLEMGDEQQTGIEGILNRLEKQRNFSLGINLEKNGHCVNSSRKYIRGDDSHIQTSKILDSAELGRGSSNLRSGSPSEGILNNSGRNFSHHSSSSEFDGSSSSLKPQTWQNWSIQRAGVSDAEFEAAEIYFDDNQMHKGNDASMNEILGIEEGLTDTLVTQKDITYNEIQSRLQNMELELASALHLLRSKRDKFVSKEGHETSRDLWKLSDTWEFQENEIMKAQDKLRTIRAKIAVLEGKMSLAIIDAQKIVEEKQNRIDGAHRALQLLRTTCIVWPNSASEVILAGSFDGWTTQRKMEKSTTGIFSLRLKLYPGRYEIKFIVDGIWKTDPLRPIVNNNGYENNLLIVT